MLSGLFTLEELPDRTTVAPVPPRPLSPFEHRFFASAARSLRCAGCAPVSWESARWQLVSEPRPRPGVALHLPRECLRCGADLGLVQQLH